MGDIPSMSEGLVLYRGESPGAIGFDIHGGYGQTWTLDPEHASAYAQGPQGYVRQALLPATAKRLVIVDPVTNDYNWADIAELERLTDNPLIARQLRNQHQIYDIWRPKWTHLIQQAGYDSIATCSIEGPEEYVLNPAKLVMLRQIPPGEAALLTPQVELEWKTM